MLGGNLIGRRHGVQLFFRKGNHAKVKGLLSITVIEGVQETKGDDVRMRFLELKFCCNVRLVFGASTYILKRNRMLVSLFYAIFIFPSLTCFKNSRCCSNVIVAIRSASFSLTDRKKLTVSNFFSVVVFIFYEFLR